MRVYVYYVYVFVCEQAVLPDTVKNMMYITSQTLDPLAAEDVGSLELGLCLHLPSGEDGGEDIWTHRKRDDGRPCLPPKRVSDVEIRQVIQTFFVYTNSKK